MAALVGAVILACTLGLALLLMPFTAWQVRGHDWPTTTRTRMLWVALAAGILLTGWMEPGLGVLLAVACWHWRDMRSSAGALVLGLVALYYAAVLHVQVDPTPVLLAALVAGAMAQGVWAAADLIYWGRKHSLSLHARRELARGAMGNRVVVGALCAIATPLAPAWALPCLVLGLIATTSYTACAAAWLGLLIAHPTWWPGLVALLPAAGGLYWWRGKPIDSWTGRTQTWRIAVATLWHATPRERWMGHGPGSFPRLAGWWTIRKWTGQFYRQAHNDLIHCAVEYGLVGALGAVLWVGSLTRGFTWNDPLTGSAVAALILAAGQFPCYLPQTGFAMLSVAALIARRLAA